MNHVPATVAFDRFACGYDWHRFGLYVEGHWFEHRHEDPLAQSGVLQFGVGPFFFAWRWALR